MKLVCQSRVDDDPEVFNGEKIIRKDTAEIFFFNRNMRYLLGFAPVDFRQSAVFCSSAILRRLELLKTSTVVDKRLYK